jgi:hypothetical protein
MRVGDHGEPQAHRSPRYLDRPLPSRNRLIFHQDIACTQARTGNIEPPQGRCEPRLRHIVMARTTTEQHRRASGGQATGTMWQRTGSDGGVARFAWPRRLGLRRPRQRDDKLT